MSVEIALQLGMMTYQSRDELGAASARAVDSQSSASACTAEIKKLRDELDAASARAVDSESSASK